MNPGLLRVLVGIVGWAVWTVIVTSFLFFIKIGMVYARNYGTHTDIIQFKKKVLVQLF